MSAIPGISTVSSQNIRDDFLKLLSAQLSNQDPMNPMDNSDMTAQMAALAELEQMENLNMNFNSLLHNFNLAAGANFIGKEITYFPDSQSTAVNGVVSEVKIADSQLKLVVGTHTVAFDEVISVKEL